MCVRWRMAPKSMQAAPGCELALMKILSTRIVVTILLLGDRSSCSRMILHWRGRVGVRCRPGTSGRLVIRVRWLDARIYKLYCLVDFGCFTYFTAVAVARSKKLREKFNNDLIE